MRTRTHHTCTQTRAHIAYVEAHRMGDSSLGTKPRSMCRRWSVLITVVNPILEKYVNNWQVEPQLYLGSRTCSTNMINYDQIWSGKYCHNKTQTAQNNTFSVSLFTRSTYISDITHNAQKLTRIPASEQRSKCRFSAARGAAQKNHKRMFPILDATRDLKVLYNFRPRILKTRTTKYWKNMQTLAISEHHYCYHNYLASAERAIK